MKKSTLILIMTFSLIIIVAIFVGWYFLNHKASTSGGGTATDQGTGFTPFGRTPTGGGRAGNDNGTTTGTSGNSNATGTIPTLRLLSDTPVGGYGASTTASTTFVRWVDRGRGNIYEVQENNANTATLSNTLLPKVYQSIWNKNASSFIGSLFNADGTASTIYAALILQATSTGTTTKSSTPFQLRGKNIPNNIVTYAVSPKGDRVFLFSAQDGHGIGYVASFDGGTITQIFDTPITQVNVEWPEENTIAITTKGSISYQGYLYFVNPKTGTWKEILSGLGLSTKVSHDAKYVLASAPNAGRAITTSIYTVSKNTAIDAVIQTLADKCTWGNFYKDIVYAECRRCYPQGSYPDDWYTGATSFSDKLWQVNATTGEAHLLSSINDQSDRIIDAFNMRTDARDDFLVFMNKNDLSLWSFDLVRSK